MENDYPINQPKTNVIAVFANLDNNHLFYLKIEEKKLEESFKKRSDIDFISIPIPIGNLNDIIDSLKSSRGRLGIFHFSGHASPNHISFNENEIGIKGFIEFFQEHHCVPLVFINGCDSYEQAISYMEVGVSAVIVTNREIFDETAANFSQQFYRGLTNNYTIKDAFSSAIKYMGAHDSNLLESHDYSNSIQVWDPRKVKGKNLSNGFPWTLFYSDVSILDLRLNELYNYINSKTLLKPYLNWLIEQHQKITVAGLKGAAEMELEKVYISLEGEIAKSYEINQSHKQIQEELDELEHSWGESNLTEKELLKAKSRLLGRNLYMPIDDERSRQKKGNKSQADFKRLNISEIISDHNNLVILGDPGTGKTTLARWLVLKHAQALYNEEAVLQIHNSSVYFNFINLIAPKLNLGRPLFPILIRVGEFAEWRQENLELNLKDFLGKNSWKGNTFSMSTESSTVEVNNSQALNQMMLNYLRNNEAILVLDGLDEITETHYRKEIVKEIEKFVDEISNQKYNAFGKRNKIIITSRIAGYQLQPISLEGFCHVTIQSMEDREIRAFSHNWILNTHLKCVINPKIYQLEVEAHEKAEAFLKEIFKPKRASLLELAGNPLFLTELAKLFYSEGGVLPGTRIELYSILANNMIKIWQEKFRIENLDFSKNKIFYVLEDVAEHLHEKYPAGLMFLPLLKERIEISLRNYNRKTEKPQIDEKIENEAAQFVGILNKQIGLLAENAEKLYGFLHLSFEEYFAARKIIRNEALIATSIINNAYKPRWREPLLMAIGSLNESLKQKDRKIVIRALLDINDPLHEIIPRSATLIAMALPEMAEPPEDEVVFEILNNLISAYANTEFFEGGVNLRQVVEETFQEMANKGRNWTTVMNYFVFKLNDTDSLPIDKLALANLIENGDWFSSSIVHALLENLNLDSELWDWPFHRCLKRVANTKPEFLEHPKLRLKLFLLQFPSAFEFLKSDPLWCKIFYLLYAIVVLENVGNKEKLKFSIDGIIRESFLSERIIDLLDKRKSPQELTVFCANHWDSDSQSYEEKVDCLIVLAAAGRPIVPMLKKITSGANSDLKLAILKRIDLINALFSSEIGIIGADVINNPGLVGRLIEGKNHREIQNFIAILLQLASIFHQKGISPFELLNVVPYEVKSTILAEFWVYRLRADDPGYSLAVTFDTLGSEFSKLDPIIIAKGFLDVNKVMHLPPKEVWNLEKNLFSPEDETGVLFHALFSLYNIHSNFEILKYWGLVQLIPLIKENPQLNNFLYYIISRFKNRNYAEGVLPLFNLNQDEDLIYSNKPNFSEDLYFNIDQELEPKARLNLIFINLSNSRVKNISNEASENFSENKISHSEFILMAGKLISQVSDVHDQIRGYLKLISYLEEGDRRNKVKLILSLLEGIQDPFLLAQFLKEIKPWVFNLSIQSKSFKNLEGKINDPIALSNYENRIYPYLNNIRDQPETNPSLAILSLGALLNDSFSLFAIPNSNQQLWEFLHSPYVPNKERIIKKICDKGREKRFKINLLVALSIDKLIKDSKFDWIYRLVECIESPEEDALTIITEWLNNSKDRIKCFAALSLLEVGIINNKTFPFIALILLKKVFGTQDLFRNRANIALNNQFFFASSIGFEGLLLIAETINANYYSSPFLLRGLSWMFEHIYFDDSKLLYDLIDNAGNESKKELNASLVLESIQLIKGDDTLNAFTGGFSHSDANIIRCLLKSSIYILNKWSMQVVLENSSYENLRQSIHQCVQSNNSEIALFAIDAMGYMPELNSSNTQLLKTIIIENVPKKSELALISLGRANYSFELKYIEEYLQNEESDLHFAATVATARNIIKNNEPTNETLEKIELKIGNKVDYLHVLFEVSKHRWWDSYSKKCKEILGLIFEKNQSKGLYVKFINSYSKHLIEDYRPKHDLSYSRSIHWMNQMVFLDALSAGAKKMPATFERNARKINGFGEKLVKIIFNSFIFTDRMNAVTCLSFLRKLDVKTIKAFQCALSDIYCVQEEAIDSSERFKLLDKSFFKLLVKNLDQETLSTRFSIIKILTAIGKSPKIDSELHQEILALLREKIDIDDYRRHVYLAFSDDGIDSNKKERIIHMGRLDNHIYNSILEITGIAIKEDY
ncbi:hypothetical protein GCM10027284_38320 [Cyclobacterium sediminis]